MGRIGDFYIGINRYKTRSTNIKDPIKSKRADIKSRTYRYENEDPHQKMYRPTVAAHLCRKMRRPTS